MYDMVGQEEIFQTRFDSNLVFPAHCALPTETTPVDEQLEVPDVVDDKKFKKALWRLTNKNRR